MGSFCCGDGLVGAFNWGNEMTPEDLSLAFIDRISSALSTMGKHTGLSLAEEHKARWDALVASTATILYLYWVKGTTTSAADAVQAFASEVGEKIALAEEPAARH